jgi:serine O-acetyltransferase
MPRTALSDVRIDGQHSSAGAEPADPIWDQIRAEVAAEVARTPMLASLLHATVLKHERLEQALSFHLANKLSSPSLQEMSIREMIDEAFENPAIGAAIRADLEAVRQRDPAAREYYVPFLFFKGFLALQSYRVANHLSKSGSRALSIYMQSRISETFGVDIHPAARIGSGVLLDHGTGIVIGETAVIDDDVSILHEVTLGGTGKESGDRHPKIRSGVLIGAGAKVLGNIVVGEGAKIGAGSVVLDSVPPHTTVAGVPAKVVGRCDVARPAFDMNQNFQHEFNDGAGI